MKALSRLLGIFTLLAFTGVALAAQNGEEPARWEGVVQKDGGTLKWKHSDRVGTSRALREIAAPGRVPSAPAGRTVREASPNPPIRTETQFRQLRPLGPDPVAQSVAPVPNMPSTAVNFEGMSNVSQGTASGLSIMPPDTNHDVGPNHIVETVNVAVQIFDKTGAALTSPFLMSDLFDGFGGQCEIQDSGDPIVLYDHLNDRWMLSQFYVNVGAGPFGQCIAVSQTGDPTGAYFLYDFADPDNEFADYPHYGIWDGALFMTVNEFNATGTAFVAGGNHAFEWDAMLAGDPALDLYLETPTFAGGLPADLDGAAPPNDTGIFAFLNADEFGGTDEINLKFFNPNFASPGATTVGTIANLSVASYDPDSPAGRADIPQPAPGLGLDSITDRLMHRLQYRNFGSRQTLVTSHTVNVNIGDTGNFHAGVRWYELEKIGAGAWTVRNEGTFAPDSDHRWMGSAAMDGDGNLAVGYSVSSASTFPSIRYAGRLAGDPVDELTQGEASLIAGSGVQTGPNRWGDYSNMAIDPVDDCTFWYSQEYYTTTGDRPWQTRIASFGFPTCDGGAAGTLEGTVTNSFDSSPIAGASVLASNGYASTTNASGFYTMSIPAGTFDVTASASGFSSVTATGVTVVDSNITTQDFALTGFPVLAIDGFVVDDSVSGNNNGDIDDDECVDITITLVNNGTSPATGVFGVLTATTPGAGAGTIEVFVDINPGSTQDATFPLTTSGIGLGSTIGLSLEVLTNEGATTLPLDVVSGTGIVGAPVVFSETVQIPIPDNTSFALADLAVSGVAGAIASVDIALHITHTWDSDLFGYAYTPDFTSAVLMAFDGGSGNNFGTDCPTTDGDDTIFSDGAATAIGSGSAPFAGTFRPTTPFSAFNGLDPNGLWYLQIFDTYAGDIGNIECWSVAVSPGLPDPGNGPCMLCDGTVAELTGPLPGSLLTASSVTFTWSPAADPGTSPEGKGPYWLDIGTTPGGFDILSKNKKSNLSHSVTGLPIDGRTIYVTVRTYVKNVGWQVCESIAYTSHTSPGSMMTSPTDGSTLSGSTQTFIWTSDPDAVKYSLTVGTTLGGTDLHNTAGSKTTRTVENIPMDGRTIFARLGWKRPDVGWLYRDYTYKAAIAMPAKLTSPTPGTTLSTTETFTWAPGSPSPLKYRISIGTTQGGEQILAAAGTGLGLTKTQGGLPTTGDVWVRIWTKFGDPTGWTYSDAKFNCGGVTNTTIDGMLDADTSPIQDGRTTRNGVASACAAAKTYPGPFNVGTALLYETHTFHAGSDACTEVRFNPTAGASPCGGSAFAVVYDMFYNPLAQDLNYLADPGSSADITFSLDTTEGQTLVVVVTNTSGITSCTYEISIADATCPF